MCSTVQIKLTLQDNLYIGTLIAHESCLLQWIQTSQADTSRAANALKCPQCGATYELESDNPMPLRILDAGNKGLSVLGRMVTAAGLTAVVVSFGTGTYRHCSSICPSLFCAGIYVLSTGYGAYALHQFLGKEYVLSLLEHTLKIIDYDLHQNVRSPPHG